MSRKIYFSLVLLLLAGFFAAAQMEDMPIDRAKIERTAENRFRITVCGDAPTPGWQIAFAPSADSKVPGNWAIDVKGTPPDGMVAQVITPYTRSEEIRIPRAAKSITVRGSNQSIVLQVPWPENSASQAMSVDCAHVERIAGRKFRVTVGGQAPTPLWKVRLELQNAVGTDPEIRVLGTPPDGMVIQVIAPYTCSHEFSFSPDVRRISIVGSNRSISLDLP